MLQKHRNIFLLAIVLVLVGGMLLLSSVRGRLGATTSFNGSFGGSTSLASRGPGGLLEDAFGLAAYDMDAGEQKMAAPSIAPYPPAPSPVPGYEAGYDESVIPEERLIIKTAFLSLLVDDVQSAIQAVITFAEANGGFEVNRNIYKSGLALTGTVTVRVPAGTFESGVGEIKKLGEVQGQQVNGQDVTEEFVDVAAQLKNLRASEAQFLTIMQRAEKIEDVLAVQRELTNIRSQIERLEGRKKYLEQSASLSTITVNVSTDPEQLPVVDQDDSWKPLAVAKDALRDLIDIGKSIGNGLIRFVIYIPVWGLLALVAFVLYRRMNRGRIE